MTAQRRLLFFLHDVEPSGAPRATMALAAALAARGRPVTLCLPARGGVEGQARALGLDVRIVPIPAGSFSAASLAGRIRLLAARLRGLVAAWRACRAPDVAGVWVGSSVAAVPMLAAALARVPLIVHVHEDLAPTRANRLRVGLVRRLARGVVFAARRSTRTLRPRPPRQPWMVLPNIMDQERILSAARDNALRGELGAQHDATVFLTVAFVTPRKGIDVLLSAFARVARSHPNARLWIAGGEVAAHADFFREQQQRTREEPLAGRVRFLGERDDIPALLAAADAFVLASRNEAFPLSIAEAMMASRPVIATDVGSVADMVRDGATGWLVPPGDDDALAAAMNALCADPTEATQRAARGYRHARHAFDRDRIARRAERFLEATGLG